MFLHLKKEGLCQPPNGQIVLLAMSKYQGYLYCIVTQSPENIRAVEGARSSLPGSGLCAYPWSLISVQGSQ